MDLDWVFRGFIVLMAGVWVGVFWLMARFSGWAELARQYPGKPDFMAAKRWNMRSARLGWCGYNNCLLVQADSSGLWLRPHAPFRFFHAPIFLPWEEVRVSRVKTWMGIEADKVLPWRAGEKFALYFPGKLIQEIRSELGVADRRLETPD